MPNLFSSNRLTLGTAQFGFNYGAFNEEGQIPYSAIVDILDYAHASGIGTLDTASGYGDSELVLGKYGAGGDPRFELITKMHRDGTVEDAVNLSCQRLQVQHLDGLLFHNYELYQKNPTLLKDFHNQKDEGRIKKIGFSLYYPEDLQVLLDADISFDMVQLQYSVFDQRFAPLFPVLKERGIEIHSRSVFLQGLYFSDPDKLSNHFDTVKDVIKEFQHLCKEHDLSIGAVCLNYALANSYLDKIIIGVNNIQNLKENLENIEDGQRVVPLLETLHTFHMEDTNILFPHFWKQETI